jgi:hypothetical protein
LPDADFAQLAGFELPLMTTSGAVLSFSSFEVASAFGQSARNAT